MVSDFLNSEKNVYIIFPESEGMKLSERLKESEREAFRAQNDNLKIYLIEGIRDSEDLNYLILSLPGALPSPDYIISIGLYDKGANENLPLKTLEDDEALSEMLMRIRFLGEHYGSA